MAKITLAFLGGDSQVDKLITGVTGGDKSHVAAYLFDGWLESTGMKEEYDPYPGVWLHNPDKYKNYPDAEFIEVDIPNSEALKEEARRLLGTPYGYSDCIRTGIYEMLGIAIADNAYAMDCSELCTRLLRAGGLDVLSDVPAGCISPEKLLTTVKEMF